MVGVIWIVQLVHYPTFLFIDEQKSYDFQKFHMSRISYIVMPAMTTELFSGIYIYIYSNMAIDSNLFLLALTILIINWIITALVFVKMHNKLLINYKIEIISLLVKWNWLRTLLWSVRLILLLRMAYLDKALD
ncbi:hypothetical protein OAP42_00795 [Candidatus Marinimicrobia bacterium]|jgi:hypothetical protein|nr:hypothetical protein [Candidatus Neomarinimicrobiota bacterium]